MADVELVELVIKIPEEVYKKAKETHDVMCDSVWLGIKKGVQLPQGHGRLIDVGQCDRKLFYQQCGGENSLITVKTAFDMLLSLPTIIEADKEDK